MTKTKTKTNTETNTETNTNTMTEALRPHGDFSGGELEVLQRALLPTLDVLSYRRSLSRLLDLLLDGSVDAPAGELLELSRDVNLLMRLMGDLLVLRTEAADRADGGQEPHPDCGHA